MSRQVYRRLLDELMEGRKASVITRLTDGKNVGKSVVVHGNDCPSEEAAASPDDMGSLAVEAVNTGKIICSLDNDGTGYLVEPYFPEPSILILGGGHVALPMVEFASKLGFKVTVVDDRPFFANEGRFPEANGVICESFERVFDRLAINSSTYVVIVTRGHKHDLICLERTLGYDPAYIGMIGSKKKIKDVFNRLREDGFGDDQLERVSAPIGLPIGAVTPSEIALSIISEIVCMMRTGGRLSFDSGKRKKASLPELDMDVMNELSGDSSERRALATIISSKGSVPRKSGAKMVIWGDGRTIGSIGGGCSESAVITASLDIIRDGGYALKHVDMTGRMAEDEGMVCGGVMEVLIESFE